MHVIDKRGMFWSLVVLGATEHLVIGFVYD